MPEDSYGQRHNSDWKSLADKEHEARVGFAKDEPFGLEDSWWQWAVVRVDHAIDVVQGLSLRNIIVGGRQDRVSIMRVDWIEDV